MWREFVAANSGRHVDILVGNKCDSYRNVSNGDAAKYAEERLMDYIEVSAKTGERISDAFNILISKILEKQKINKFLDKDDKLLQSTQLLKEFKENEGLGLHLNCCN